MVKRFTLILAVAALVLFTAGATWGAKLDPQNFHVPFIKGDEAIDYLMSSASGVFPTAFCGETVILSPYDTCIGCTWYDYQHNSRIPRMNQNDYQEFVLTGPPDTLGNGLHYCFMFCDSWGVGNKRYIAYAYQDPPDGWTGLPAAVITKQGFRAGYTGMVVTRPLDGYFKNPSRGVVIYHTTEPVYPNTDDMGVRISIEPSDPGAGDMEGGAYWYDIPDSVDFEESSFKGMWPSGDIDSLNRIHIVFTEGDTAAGWSWQGYVRCEERPGDSLMCWAPGKDSVHIEKETQYFEPLNQAAFFAKSGVIGVTAVTSKVSNRVALVWPSLAEVESDSGYYQVFNDVFYMESFSGGDDWFSGGFPARTNITKYDSSDLVRCYGEVSAVYDLDDSLHVFWHTHYRDIATDGYDGTDVALWHWSKATVRICDGDTLPGVKVHQAGWEAYPGAWNRNIAKITSGVGVLPDSNENYLYVHWTQFDTAKLNDDGNATQGDLYATVSTDGGFTWNVPVNFTNSTAPACAAGNCASDHWGSMAERVDSMIYTQWVYDLDAGGVPQDEGEATNSPVLIRNVNISQIPIEDKARIGWSPRDLISPYVSVPTTGTTKKYLTIENLGTATLSAIDLSSAAEATWLTIGSYNTSISAGGCPEVVELTFTGQGAEEFYVDSIHVTSNDQAGNADFYVRLHVVMSDVYVKPQFTEIGNPIFYLGESNVGNLAHTTDTLGMYMHGDANDPNFLYDGTALLAFTSPTNDTLVSRYIFEDEYFLPETDVMVDTAADLKTIVVEAEFNPVTPQAPMPWHHAWWWWTIKMKDYIFYSGADCKNEQYIALKIIKLYYNPPPPWWPFSDPLASVPKHYLGMAFDIDAISDSGAWNNPGSYDEIRRMTFLRGYGGGANENYRMAVAQKDQCFDTLHATEGQMTYCWRDNDNPDFPKQMPYGMHILRNDSTVYPSGGYVDEELYTYMATPGNILQGDGSPADYNIVWTGKSIAAGSFPPADTHQIAGALVISDQYDIDKLNATVDMVKCGNVNRDGSVTVGDVVYFIAYLFRGGPEIWTYMGDANGDGVSNITDCVYLVNYLFKSGPPPKCSSI
jgi:hypothetical protein